MNRNDKKTLARQLFITGDLQQKEIAKQIGVTETTMSKWINRFKWKQERAVTKELRPQLIHNIYFEILNIQGRAIKEKRDSSISESNLILNKLRQLHKVELEQYKKDAIAYITEFESFCAKRIPEQKEMLSILKNEFLVNNFSKQDGFI